MGEMRFLVGAGVALLAGIVPASGQGRAENWVRVTDELMDYAVDRNSIRREGALIRAWTRFNQTGPSADGTTAQVSENLFHCTDRTVDMVRYQHRGADGRMILDQVVAADQRQVEPVLPDSPGELALDYVCRNGR